LVPAILQAWRDDYADSIGELTPITREAAVAYFEQMIANIRDPRTTPPTWSTIPDCFTGFCRLSADMISLLPSPIAPRC